MFPPQNSVAVASIHLPLAGTPFPSSTLQSVDNSTCKLQFIVFRNGKLFPCTGNSSNLADDGKRRSVSTPVAFTKLGKRKIHFYHLVCDVNAVLVDDMPTHARAHTHTHSLTGSACFAQHAITKRHCVFVHFSRKEAETYPKLVLYNDNKSHVEPYLVSAHCF